MDKCAAAGGSPMRLDGPRTDRAALGGIQAAGSFGRMRMRTARGAITELASRRSEVEKAAWASDQSMGDLDKNAPPMGLYLNFSIRGSCVFSRAKSLDYIREGRRLGQQSLPLLAHLFCFFSIPRASQEHQV